MALKLTEAKKWVLSARSCLSRIDYFLLSKDKCLEKVKYVEIEELVAVRYKASCESSLTQLQVCKISYCCSSFRETLKFTLLRSPPPFCRPTQRKEKC